MDSKGYYKLLGVAENASQEEIKKMLGCISTVCYMKDFKLDTITEVKVDDKGMLTTRSVYEREAKHDSTA